MAPAANKSIEWYGHQTGIYENDLWIPANKNKIKMWNHSTMKNNIKALEKTVDIHCKILCYPAVIPLFKEETT